MSSSRGIFWSQHGSGVRLFIRASPNAKRNEIAGLWSGPDSEMRLAVKVAAPPDKGKANAVIIKLLAKALGAPKSAFIIASGETSRLKTIDINGDANDLAAALAALGEAE